MKKNILLALTALATLGIGAQDITAAGGDIGRQQADVTFDMLSSGGYGVIAAPVAVPAAAATIPAEAATALNPVQIDGGKPLPIESTTQTFSIEDCYDPELDAIHTDTDDEQLAAITKAYPENRREHIKEWWQRHTQGAPYTHRHRPLLLKEVWEDKLGAILYKRFLSGAYLAQNQDQLAIFNRVSQRMSAVSGRPDWQWEFKLMNMGPTDASGITGDLNQAFALPGGKIGVLTGMLYITENDSGLAALLGHEMAHAIARHMGERITQMVLIQAGFTMAGALVPVYGLPLLIPAAVHGGLLLNMAQSIYRIGSDQGHSAILSGFSKIQEREADYIGLILMAKAGYDPVEGVAFWKELLTGTGQQSKHGIWDMLKKYFMLHPFDAKRITKMESYVQQVRQQYYNPPAKQAQ